MTRNPEVMGQADDAVPWEGMRCEVVLHATWVQHGVTSQPAEAANGGDIWGTTITHLGMIRKLLTDARETSYVM
jgi:hypothetical protein